MSSETSAGALVAPRVRPTATRALIPAIAWVPVMLVTLFAGGAVELTAALLKYHGDELYFLASGQHLSWGYADQGFLVPFLAWLGEQSGGSPLVVRAPAVLATMAGIVLTALIAREFGGGRWTQTVAALAYCASPRVLDTGGLLLTQTFDIPLWIATTLLLARWARTGTDRLFWPMGIIAAVAFTVKPLIAVFWACCLAVLLVRGQWRRLRRPLWTLIVPAALGALPYLLWQWRHGFPQLHLVPVVTQETSEFAGGRLTVLPLTLVTNGALAGTALAVYGCWVLLRDKRMVPYRFLGWTYLAVLAVVVVAGGRYYYCAGLFPVCWAAGAGKIASYRGKPRWRSLIVPVSAFSAFIVLLISLATVAPHAPAWSTGVALEAKSEQGWSQVTDTVATAYAGLPADIRGSTTIVTEHYWQASALNWYGAARQLPPAYSPHRGYSYFGQPADADQKVLFVGPDPAQLGTACTLLATTPDTPGFPGINQGVPVWLCDKPHQSWAQLWPHLSHS